MELQTRKLRIVYGALLILFGGLLLVETFIDLSAWVWIGALTIAGLGVYAVYATDRSERWLLVLSYTMLAIALMVALITLDVLQDSFVATYVLTAIALPFLYVYLSDRTHWWAIIPAYILLAIGVMVGLIEGGILDDNLVATYVLLSVAIPFFVIYARDRKQWWALIPGGITGLIGLALFVAEAAAEYIVPAVLIIVGAWVLIRQFTRREPTAMDAPEPVEPETDQLPAE
ncbi:MAG: hypothetical protein AMJ88_13990 [Anaerolineae bacterium SM23_ 63]|nr:MAG: hypothetical protein AMJ88_13990 [Anaerolineae bacterium SM23_ 63]HEY46344.1 hypothetical protein [Anaerolineae bacterium]